MPDSIRWGVVGTGDIAGVFTRELGHLPDHQMVAVGSRNLERAKAFAATHDLPRAYGSYAEVADDPDVDVVYVANPHSGHYAATKYALEAGKAVLCEKAFTTNAREARELIALARERRLFLMEAMWMRCNPLHLKLRELVLDGAIGEPLSLRAEFGFTATYGPDTRLFSPATAGGALLDVGVYPVALAYHLFGVPDEIIARASLAPTGVDASHQLMLRYDGHLAATLTGSLVTELSNTAAVGGTEGWIELPRSFHDTDTLTLYRKGRDPETVRIELLGAGYVYEAEEVAAGVRAGAVESTLVTHADTLAVMDILDDVRRQIGLRYPNEDVDHVSATD